MFFFSRPGILSPPRKMALKNALECVHGLYFPFAGLRNSDCAGTGTGHWWQGLECKFIRTCRIVFSTYILGLWGCSKTTPINRGIDIDRVGVEKWTLGRNGATEAFPSPEISATHFPQPPEGRTFTERAHRENTVQSM